MCSLWEVKNVQGWLLTLTSILEGHNHMGTPRTHKTQQVVKRGSAGQATKLVHDIADSMMID